MPGSFESHTISSNSTPSRAQNTEHRIQNMKMGLVVIAAASSEIYSSTLFVLGLFCILYSVFCIL
jgi:hypothetical protein